MDAAIAPNAAANVYEVKEPSFDNCCKFQALLQFAFQTSPLIAINPKTINPNKLNSFANVKVVCMSLPFLIPLVLMNVRITMTTIDNI